MKKLRHPFVLLIALGWLCLSTIACNCAAWEAAKAERMQKIDNQVRLIEEREASRPERLERMEDRIHQSADYHAEHLESTRAYVHREWESDITRWYEERPKRQEFVRRYWCGQPETIPGTWERMVY